MLKAWLTAALIAITAAYPATAHASDLTSLMKRIAVASEKTIDAAEKPKAKLTDVANKAATLSAIMVSLQVTIERNPNEAAEHIDALKGIAQDMTNMGMILMSAAGMTDDDESAAVTIEQIEKLAMSIRDNAQMYD